MECCGQSYDPAVLPSGKRPSTNFTRGLMGFRVGLGECGISHRHRDSIPGTLYLYLVTIPPALSLPTIRNGSLPTICKEPCVFAPANSTPGAGFLKSLVGGSAIVLTFWENTRNEHSYLIFFSQ